MRLGLRATKLAASKHKPSHPPEIKDGYDERQRPNDLARSLGIEYPSEICWQHWGVGEEIEKNITLKNVGLKTAFVYYKPPRSRAFSLPLPETRKVPPGISFSIPVVFRPQTLEPVKEQLELSTQHGCFSVSLVAKGEVVSVSLPQKIDFGQVAISSERRRTLTVKNTGDLAVECTWRSQSPFEVEPSVCRLPVGGSVRCVVSFTPDKTCWYSAVAVCELRESHSLAAASCFLPDKERSRLSLSAGDDAGLDPRDRASPQKRQILKAYQLQLRGTGRIPQLLINGKTQDTFDCGSLLPGQLLAHSFTLSNTSSASAHFEVRMHACRIICMQAE